VVSHPARWAGKLALADRAWQQQQRERLQTASQHLHDWLEKCYGNPVVSTALFAYVLLTEQEALQAYEQLARQGILVRLFQQPWALRFGLPEVSLTSVNLLSLWI
jgi:cobalamin biosynthetic protein CobC